MFTLEQKEFIRAAEKGNLVKLERLVNLISDPKEKDKFIHIGTDFAFELAAKNGHLAVVKKLLELTPNVKKRKNMIKANNYRAFTYAIEFSNLEVAEELLKNITNSEERQCMISAGEYMAFKIVIERKDLSTFEYLLSVFPEKLFKTISNNIVNYIGRILPLCQHKDFTNKIINKFDEDFIQSVILHRESNLGINVGKIFDSIKFIPNILGLAQIGIDKLQESFFDYLKLPQFVAQKILSYCYGERSNLNSFDMEKVYSIIGDINKEIIDPNTIKIYDKSSKISFVEKYIEQTKKSENIIYNL